MRIPSIAPVTAQLSDLLYDRAILETIFLPTGQMLQLDRVIQINGNELVAEMDVLSHWVFPMHFPGDPIFPGSLLIESAGQAVAVWAWHAGIRGRPRMLRVTAKFKNPVTPGDGTVVIRTVVHRRKSVCIGEVLLEVNGHGVAEVRPMIMILSD